MCGAVQLPTTGGHTINNFVFLFLFFWGVKSKMGYASNRHMVKPKRVP